ncbi:hypothetical protein A1O3_04421 [Capronia epimyces CBS 606.96]|uniref:Uncharacterized protein n=1 Tax=Capronia epimyces CBS 606.96 TaxID=1182542 RepID=W9YDX9_9EURO|nr:uncharacterized protein A1O3_04421 [Capronia epimyces CBS 606.96]EXJ87461.1 hypothetical protein A1O3_04421 [Capronia epimyces CBS 606.96]
MIGDIGAGSADFEAWEIVDVHPLRVRQLHASQTEWCGARTINVEFRRRFLQSISDRKEAVLSSLRTVDTTMDWQTLGERLEASFEGAKKDFRAEGDDSYILRIPGLPNMPEKSMPRGGRIEVDADLMRESHQPQLNTIIQVIRDTLRAIERRRSHGLVESCPDELLMAGGGGNNNYICRKIRETLEPDGISVSLPTA